MLECPLCNPIRDKFPSLFENVVARSLKSFLQIEQQVNISFYLTEANTLCHSRKSLGLKPSWCIFSPISFFGFLNFIIIFISFQLYWLAVFYVSMIQIIINVLHLNQNLVIKQCIRALIHCVGWWKLLRNNLYFLN